MLECLQEQLLAMRKQNMALRQVNRIKRVSEQASKVVVVAVVRLVLAVEGRLPPYIHVAPTTAAFYRQPHEFCDDRRLWMGLLFCYRLPGTWYVRVLQ